MGRRLIVNGSVFNYLRYRGLINAWRTDPVGRKSL